MLTLLNGQRLGFSTSHLGGDNRRKKRTALTSIQVYLSDGGVSCIAVKTYLLTWAHLWSTRQGNEAIVVGCGLGRLGVGRLGDGRLNLRRQFA